MGKHQENSQRKANVFLQTVQHIGFHPDIAVHPGIFVQLFICGICEYYNSIADELVNESYLIFIKQYMCFPTKLIHEYRHFPQ